MEKKGSEKRKHPRHSIGHGKELAKIEIKKGDEVVAACEMKNISLSGMYCKVKKYIFPLTKVKGSLQLPVQIKNSPLHLEKVLFSGVVVRIDPERETGGCNEYEVAVFFQDMEFSDKEKIASYLKSHS